MSVATIKLVNMDDSIQFYVNRDSAVFTARRLLAQGSYSLQGTMAVQGLEGEAAAEELFDLTNNPSRQAEREQLYGRHRSISVGDIVNVDGSDWLCCSTGWKEL